MMRRTRSTARTVALAAVVGLALAVGCSTEQAADAPTTTTTAMDHSAHVRERGAEVMPFDLSRSTHRFEDTPQGVVETVTTREPVDDAQVAIIRNHLTEEASKFAEGNFDDPARIHGDDMPGLATLRAKASSLVVEYEDVDAGGRITYTSTDPEVVEALHQFGKAQTQDHAGH